eukprot:359206-Chlamydomonas_euryale.AAC.2
MRATRAVSARAVDLHCGVTETNASPEAAFRPRCGAGQGATFQPVALCTAVHRLGRCSSCSRFSLLALARGKHRHNAFVDASLRSLRAWPFKNIFCCIRG